MNAYEEKVAAFLMLVGQSFSQSVEEMAAQLNEVGKSASGNISTDKNDE